MTHTLKNIPLLLIFLFGSAEFLYAQTAVGIKAGTTGIGLEVVNSLNNNFNARVNASFFAYGRSGEVEDDPNYNYDLDGSVKSFGAVVDYFPFNNWFKFTGGIYYHDFLVEGLIQPSEPYEVEGKVFQPERLGEITGQATYKSKIVPYLGLGVGNAVNQNNRVKVGFELGAMFTNNPNVDMQGKGMIAPTANQADTFEDAMYSFKLYPVLNISLTTRL